MGCYGQGDKVEGRGYGVGGAMGGFMGWEGLRGYGAGLWGGWGYGVLWGGRGYGVLWAGLWG